MARRILALCPDTIQLAGCNATLSSVERQNDALDDFNHPRQRRLHILQSLQAVCHIEKVACTESSAFRRVYGPVHSEGLIQFLLTAWTQWSAMGAAGWDPMGCLNGEEISNESSASPPPLVPGNTPLPRLQGQRPSKHVLGQIGYYCTDTCTPIFAELLDELEMDACIVEHACSKNCQDYDIVYALTTHPGHHAARDSFGGYCYVNHAAAATRLLQTQHDRVVILDVDYHCGNGTASLLEQNENCLMISIHCDPDHEYPFHSGFASDDPVLNNVHLPLPPGTQWAEYSKALQVALERIRAFAPDVLVLSLGFDTHDNDPCAIRRAGFKLMGTDYESMGHDIALCMGDKRVIVIQEGGYHMESLGEAATNVLVGLAAVPT